MSLWTIELVRTEVGPKSWFLSGRREQWLWRAYRGSNDFSAEDRQKMYDANEYSVGLTSGRFTPRSDALREAQEFCETDDLKRGQEIREVVGYDTHLRPG